MSDRGHKYSKEDLQRGRQRAQKISHLILSNDGYRQWRTRLVYELEAVWQSDGPDTVSDFRGPESGWERVRRGFDTNISLFLADFDIDEAWEPWVAAEVVSSLTTRLRDCLDVLGGTWERTNQFRRGLTIALGKLLPIDLYIGPVTRTSFDGSVTVRYPPHHPTAVKEKRNQEARLDNKFPDSDFKSSMINSMRETRRADFRYAGRNAILYHWYQLKRMNYTAIAKYWMEATGEDLAEEAIKKAIGRHATTHGLPRRLSNTLRGRGRKHSEYE